MTNNCPKCGATMERGLTRVRGAFLNESTPVQFLISGTPAPLNPIKAFRQGLQGQGQGQGDQLYGIVGMRCSACGYLELYAERE
jgi:predicted nucleic-acid-binding Zn-ribbon protein